MALTTQLLVKIAGNADGIISALAKTGKAGRDATKEIASGAKQDFEKARKEADRLFKDVNRLQKEAATHAKAGNTGLAGALSSQAAAQSVEFDKASIAVVAAQRRLQAEAAKTVASHAAEAAGVSKLGAATAQQGGAIQRFLGSFSGAGGASKSMTVLKDSVSSLGTGTGLLGGLTTGASTALSSLAVSGKSAGVGLGGAAVGAAAAAAGIGIIGKAVSSGLEKFQSYASEVRGVQKITGASAEEASKFGGQLRHFALDVDAGSKALGIFAKNAVSNGGAKLEALGITIARTKDGNVDLLRTLENAGDRFKQYGKGAEGTNLALQAFGRGGATLIPILNQTREALHGINAETARQGLVFDAKELDNARELSLASRKVHHAVDGLLVTFAKGLAPIFTEQTQGATKLIEAVTGVTESVGGAKGLFGGLVGGVEALIPGVGQAIPLLGLYGEATSKADNAGAKWSEELKRQSAAAATVTEQVEGMGEAFDLLVGRNVKATQAQMAYQDAQRALGKSFAENGRTLAASTDAGSKNVAAVLALVNASDSYAQSIATQSGSIDKGAAAQDRFNAKTIAALSTMLGSRSAAESYALKLGLIDKSGIAAARGIHLTDAEMKILGGDVSSATSDLQKFNNELDRLTGVNLSAIETDIRFRDSLVDLQKAMRENGPSFDLATEAGRKNQTALDQSIGSVVAHAKAVGDHETALHGEVAGLAASNSVLQAHRTELINSAAASGMSKAAATLLVDAILKIPTTPIRASATFDGAGATGAVETFAEAVRRARREAEAPIRAKLEVQNPFSLRFGGNLGLRAFGGPVDRDKPYEVGEKGAELFVARRDTPGAISGAAHLVQQADKESREGLVRLGIPGGIEPKAVRRGTQALLLGKDGPQMFTPPTDGVVVKASDTARLLRTENADIITRILKRAGLDKRTLDAMGNAPGLAGGGRAKKGETYRAGEKGVEAYIPGVTAPPRSTPSPTAMPGVQRTSDGSYTFNIGGDSYTIQGSTQGQGSVSKAEVEKLVDRKKRELANELSQMLEAGKR